MMPKHALTFKPDILNVICWGWITQTNYFLTLLLLFFHWQNSFNFFTNLNCQCLCVFLILITHVAYSFSLRCCQQECFPVMGGKTERQKVLLRRLSHFNWHIVFFSFKFFICSLSLFLSLSPRPYFCLNDTQNLLSLSLSRLYTHSHTLSLPLFLVRLCIALTETSGTCSSRLPCLLTHTWLVHFH